MMKNRIIIYISFIAVLVSIITILLSTIFTKNDLKFTSLILGIIASVFGAFLAMFYKKITTQRFKGKIYLSFAAQDRKVADFIRERLISKNFTLNIDEKNIPIGENIKSVIEKDLNSASIFIVLISTASIESDWVKYEIETALKNNRKILPVLIEDGVKIPEVLRYIKYADFTSDKYKSLNELIKALDINLRDEKSVHNNV